MNSNPLEKEDEYSFAAFVERVQLKPAGFTPGGTGVTIIKEKNKPITVRFPVERRMVVYYAPITL
jgi:hypothetical protein